MLLAIFNFHPTTFAQGTAFTYQGRLDDSGNPVNGIYDLRFDLFDDITPGGPSTGMAITKSAINVSNGLFTVNLDFGGWIELGYIHLEISVRTNGGGAFAILNPRQTITAAPLAVFATSAGTAYSADFADFTFNAGFADFALSASSVEAINISGTMADAQLSSNVALRSGGNTFSGTQVVTNGNVGIGTTTPSRLLEVGGPPGTEGLIRLQSRSTNGGAFRIWEVGVPKDDVSVDGKFYSFVIDDVLLGNKPELLIQYNTGNVGIGTTNPSVPLQVEGEATWSGGPNVRGVITGIQTSGDASSAGVVGIARVPGAYGVVGQSDINLDGPIGPAAANIGVAGTTSTTNGTGVYGVAGASSGVTFAVAGIAPSPQGFAGFFYGRGYFSGNVGIGTTAPDTALHVNGTVTATAFAGDLAGNVTGNGAGLTNVNASQLSSGTVADARLSSNVALRSGGNAFTGNQVVTNGSVGIGTASPGKKLEVAGSVGPVAVSNSVEASVLARLVNTASDGTFTIPNAVGLGFGRDSTRQAIVGSTFGNDYLDFYTSGVLTWPKMRIDANGNVGIATTTPSRLLEVGGSLGTEGLIRLQSKSTNGIAQRIWDVGVPKNDTNAAGKFFSFVIDDTQLGSEPELLVQYASGNVGIGTTNPLARLDVNGAVRATSFDGNGGNLTGLSASQLTGGTVADARLSSNVALRTGGNTFSGSQTFSGPVSVSSGISSTAGNSQFNFNGSYGDVTMTLRQRVADNIILAVQDTATFNRFQVTPAGVSVIGAIDASGTNTAAAFMGNGAGLTSLNGTNLQNGSVTAVKIGGTLNTAQIPNLDASKITGGIIADALLSTNVAMRTGSNIFQGNQYLPGSRIVMGSGNNPFGRINIKGDGRMLVIQSTTNIGPGVGAYAEFMDATGAVEGLIGADGLNIFGGTNRFVVGTWTTNAMVFGTAGLIRMTIDAAGRVGIGNNNPTNLLMVGNARCDGSTWIAASDRNLKQDFAAVDPQAVLDKVASLPIQSWSYKAQPDQKHVGPVAQDFRAAFGLGQDDTSIATVDADGVALAAIQGLNQKVEKENAILRSENVELKARLEKIEQLLERRMNGGSK